MSRTARQLSQTGIYHVTFRGMNHCHIFEDDADYRKILDIIFELKKEIQFELYAYCLMSNHVHLLLKEQITGDIITIMRRMLTKYAGWFNKKYSRSGSLVGNRYKSECVELDEYFVNVIRYIHQNPIRAGIVNTIGDYKWTSYHDYINSGNCINLIDKEFVLKMFNETENTNSEQFIFFHEEHVDCKKYVNYKKITEEELYLIVKKILGGNEPNTVIQLPIVERNNKIRDLKNRGFSTRQLERVLGISKGTISRC